MDFRSVKQGKGRKVRKQQPSSHGCLHANEEVFIRLLRDGIRVAVCGSRSQERYLIG